MALGVAVLTLAAATAGGGARPALMPWPASIETGPGEMVVGPGFRVAVTGKGGPIVERAAGRLLARLGRQTGYVLPSPLPVADAVGLEIRCDAPGKPLPHLGMDESYTLTVGKDGAVLQSAEPWGALRGMETFLQLVETGSRSAFRVREVVVKDRPRFPWRGLMLDSCRHFMPVDVVEADPRRHGAVKLNVFHWHLTDDQGFRIESRRLPGAAPAWARTASSTRRTRCRHDHRLRARARHPRVPEFDMPGHTTSWFVGHPELAATPGPYAIERRVGDLRPRPRPLERGGLPLPRRASSARWLRSSPTPTSTSAATR